MVSQLIKKHEDRAIALARVKAQETGTVILVAERMPDGLFAFAITDPGRRDISGVCTHDELKRYQRYIGELTDALAIPHHDGET